MTDKFAYVIPMHEGNTTVDELEFWTRRNETFRVYLHDEKGPFDSVNVATRDEAIKLAKEMAAEFGWTDYQLSIDE